MIDQIRFYKDVKCQKPIQTLSFDFSEEGTDLTSDDDDTMTLTVYMRNEGPHDLFRIRVFSGDPSITVKSHPSRSLKRGEVNPLILIWKPSGKPVNSTLKVDAVYYPSKKPKNRIQAFNREGAK